VEQIEQIYTSLFTKRVAKINKTNKYSNFKKTTKTYKNLTKYYRLLQNFQKPFTRPNPNIENYIIFRRE